MLLRFAAEQAIKVAMVGGCFALELEADNEQARPFYLKHGFLELKPVAMKLYQSVTALERAIE